MFFHRQPQERDPLWKREVRERWRRPWTFLLLGVYAATLAILARVFYGALVPQGDIAFSKQGLGLGAPLFWKFVSWQIAGWVPLGLLLGAPAIALERERRSLVELVLAGIESRQIVRAKWSSLASFALVLVVAPLPVAALCFPLGGVSPFDFVAANTLCVGIALASCAMGLAISATHKSVSAALSSALQSATIIGIFVSPLFLFAPLVAPEWLLGAGLLIGLLPLYLLPRIEGEVFFLSRHLEVDAPQTPDYSPTPDDVPLRLEPLKRAISYDAALAGEPMNPFELARYMNAAEAERGNFDPPPSHFDEALESVTRNVLARRDVRTQLRTWRRAFLIGEPAPAFSLRAALWTGGTFCALGVMARELELSSVLHVLFGAAILLGVVQVTLLSSGGFARERAGNMMAQLQLSALSPSEIVGAKIVAPIILSTRFWGVPILALALTALSYDPLRVVLEWVLAGELLLLSALLGTVSSLFFRAVSLATCVAIGTLVMLFVVVPSVFSPMLFAPPLILQQWWLEPLRALISGKGELETLAHLLVPVGVLEVLSWRLALRLWKRCVEAA